MWSRGGPGVRRRRARRRGAEPVLGLIVLLQTLTLAVSGPATSSEYLPIRVAEGEGYFAREGLDVTVRTTRAESGAAEALAQGQVDLAATTLEALLRFGPRVPSQTPRLVFGLTAAPPFSVLVACARAGALRAVAEALVAAQERSRRPGAEGLAAGLLSRVAGGKEEFRARFEAARACQLPDGLVSAEGLQQTIGIIRAHTPLPGRLRIPRPEAMLHLEPLQKAIKARRAS